MEHYPKPFQRAQYSELVDVLFQIEENPTASTNQLIINAEICQKSLWNILVENLFRSYTIRYHNNRKYQSRSVKLLSA